MIVTTLLDTVRRHLTLCRGLHLGQLHSLSILPAYLPLYVFELQLHKHSQSTHQMTRQQEASTRQQKKREVSRQGCSLADTCGTG